MAASAQLADQVALVTGAASGIGRASARRLAAAGASVCCVDMSPDVKGVADEVGGISVRGDVGDPDVNAEAVEACEQEWGGLHVAHLNAGVVTGEADVTRLADDAYRRILGVNVDGVVFGTRAAVPVMERSGGGCIVATASLAGLIAYDVDPIYALTKHAVVGFVRSTAEQLAARGIRINCVNPGIVATPLVPDDAQEMLRDADFPLLDPDDIAETVMRIVGGDGTGEAWPVQPGREPEPYRFHQVPGPRTEGARGRKPPGMSGS